VAACRAAQDLARAGIRLRRPDADDALSLMLLRSGRASALRAGGHRVPEVVNPMPDPDPMPDLLEVARRFVATLDQLGVNHAIGGAVACSVHGEPRSTEDVDVAADIRPEDVSALLAALSREFYVPENQLRFAVRNGTSFSVIHTASVFKVDVFVVGPDPLGRQELLRRQPLALGGGSHTLYVTSPEDTLLQKLLWFKKGGEVSDRQWRDILGILKVQADTFDVAYARRWARATRTDLLFERALREAGLTTEPPA
jgi:hypothetical protein